jgi:archaellum component FlaC
MADGGELCMPMRQTAKKSEAMSNEHLERLVKAVESLVSLVAEVRDTLQREFDNHHSVLARQSETTTDRIVGAVQSLQPEEPATVEQAARQVAEALQ